MGSLDIAQQTTLETVQALVEEAKTAAAAAKTAAEGAKTAAEAGGAEGVYIPSNTVIQTILNSEKSTNNTKSMYLGRYIPKRSGIVRVITKCKGAYSNSMGYIFAISTSPFFSYGGSGAANSVINELDTLSVGATTTWTANSLLGKFDGANTGFDGTSYKEQIRSIAVVKGMPVYFLISSYSGDVVYCNNIKICGTEMEC